MKAVSRRGNESGMALVTTMMVLMLASALMIGFFAAIVADQRANGIDRDQSQAYAAAHAGLEKLTSDLATLFEGNFAPTSAAINTLATRPPAIPGFNFIAPGGAAGSGYAITYPTDAQGNPAPVSPNGTPITAGVYQGFNGIITQYTLTSTARSTGNAEVRLRRVLETVSVPVFQFGMFSETDLSFFAGPNFAFGGRVHTNGNLFVAEGGANTLTLSDRVTVAGEVIRRELSNGYSSRTNAGYTGTVSLITAPGVFRNMGLDEGSVKDGLGAPISGYPLVLNELPINPGWTSISTGTYKSNIVSSRTGGKQLFLPLVSQGAQSIDLIRRAPQGEDPAGVIFPQRYFAMASVRILLSDTAADILNLPTVTGAAPVALDNTGPAGYSTPGALSLVAPFAVSGGPAVSGEGGGANVLPANTYLSPAGTPLLNGFIKIELKNAAGAYQDVTAQILSLGITGRGLSDGRNGKGGSGNGNGNGNGADKCPNEPYPNAVIRLQRVRDVPKAAAYRFDQQGNNNQPCGFSAGGAAISPSGDDYWPTALYDTREGNLRDANAANSATLAFSGVMHYVELDVNNLRRWLAGTIPAAGSFGPNAVNQNGFIVYFSDRRNNRNAANLETAEYGFEDVINPADVNGAPNAVLDLGEDVNATRDPGYVPVLDTYGQMPVNLPAGAAAPMDGNARTFQTIVAPGGTTADLVARANRPLFFRRALKLVNGGINGGTASLPAPGLTVAAENPVYVQGNYNATSVSATANPHVAAAVLADAVTLLSASWNDINSFVTPNDPTKRDVGANTSFRMAIAAGKGLSFKRPTWNGVGQDFGTDGGAHNFLRYLERWSGDFLNYRGSIVSLYISRQAIGTYKCCANVYGPPTRNYNFDTDFLLPSLLPPGTPMFRDVNTLTFRQLLRPTQ